MPRARWTIAIALPLALLAAPMTLGRVEHDCDPVTGSQRWVTRWPLGIVGNTRIVVSPLEARLRSIGYPLNPEWRGFHTRLTNLWGGTRGWECGTPPAVYRLSWGLEWYARVATDDEVRRFADTMATGTEDEQKVALDAAEERALAAIGAS